MKKILVLFFAMSMFSVLFAQAQSGSFKVGADHKGYTLHANEGLRTYSIDVTFEKPFDVKPEIILSTTLMDIPVGTPTLYEITASAISRDCFVINIKTWNNGKIINVGGSWLAVGIK